MIGQGRKAVKSQPSEASSKIESTSLLPYPALAGMRSAYVEVHGWLVCISYGRKHLRPSAADWLASAPTELPAAGITTLQSRHL